MSYSSSYCVKNQLRGYVIHSLNYLCRGLLFCSLLFCSALLCSACVILHLVIVSCSMSYTNVSFLPSFPFFFYSVVSCLKCASSSVPWLSCLVCNLFLNTDHIPPYPSLSCNIMSYTDRVLSHQMSRVLMSPVILFPLTTSSFHLSPALYIYFFVYCKGII